MTTDARISLRDAALRLAGYPRFRKTQSGGKRELFQLLQGQELQAAFDFPGDARPRIDIPAKFWIDTRSGEFVAQLTSSSKRGKHGQFLIDPAKFIDQYVAWFSDNFLGDGVTPEKQTTASVELAAAFVGMKTKKEAYILESGWAHFVNHADVGQVGHLDEATQSTKGRRPLEAWEDVLVEVAAEMLAMQAQSRPLDGEQSTIAANSIFRAEKQSRQRRFPKTDTVAKKISLILERMKALIPPAGD